MKITIKNTDYTIKYTVRAMFVFEQITNKNFEISSSLDQYIFMYSVILANNPENILSWDDFIEAVDENPNLMQDFLRYLTEYNNSRRVFQNEEETEDADDEKKN